MTTKIITKKQFKTSRWSGGQTTELYIYPEQSNYKARNFMFRLSSATVELEKSNFTPLDGIKRFIAPINGPLKLNHESKEIYLDPFQCYAFDGGLQTTSEGKVTDFNLMLSKSVSGTLESFYLEEAFQLKSSHTNDNNKVWMIYSPAISLSISNGKTYQLPSGDLVIFHEPSDLDISSNEKGYFFLAEVIFQNK